RRAAPTRVHSVGRRPHLCIARWHSGAMGVLAIDHVQLAMPPGVEAEARAEEFYSGALGLPWVPKPEPLAGRGGCWFSNGVVALHLGVEQDFRPARKAHPALIVDDLAGL